MTNRMTSPCFVSKRQWPTAVASAQCVWTRSTTQPCINLVLWLAGDTSKCQVGTHLALEPRQNGRHFADDIFNCILLKVAVHICIELALKLTGHNDVDSVCGNNPNIWNWQSGVQSTMAFRIKASSTRLQWEELVAAAAAAAAAAGVAAVAAGCNGLTLLSRWHHRRAGYSTGGNHAC